MGFILINQNDNVLINTTDAHKYARCDISAGEEIIKYGFPIGIATKDIKKDEHIHSHNLKTALQGTDNYRYIPNITEKNSIQPVEISVYERTNGEIGIRNDIWIIPTVGCINKTAEKIAKETDSFVFTHPYGCSQLGDDHLRSQKILKGLITHPNAGAVLVLGLGCENNNINELKKILGDFNTERIRFLNLQDTSDEITQSIEIINKLKQIVKKDIKIKVPISKINIGMKCGGSDGLSGITANPLCGELTDAITSMGGTSVLTEVPEMFGAEKVLYSRCKNAEIFKKTQSMINNYKKYFISHGEPISENPSPGNKAGGITTLEEKSLGCVTKGGCATITDVLSYGEKIKEKGLNLLDGPGNDMVAITNLTAAGCHLILFTTGRGTPLGAPIPTLKIATNSTLAENKPHWIDFDASKGTKNELLDLIVKTIEGKQTKNEINSYREIAIMKDGVVL